MHHTKSYLVSSQLCNKYTLIPRFWQPRFWRPSQIGDFIYLVSSWAHLLHTYNLDFGDLNFDRPKNRQNRGMTVTLIYVEFLEKKGILT